MTAIALPKTVGDQRSPAAANAGPIPSANEWRVLFVGGAALWWHQTERDLHCLQPTWQCQGVEGVAQAAAALASSHFDAMILDGHVPGGVDLLNKVGSEHPNTICLVRCDLLDSRAASQWSQTGATLLTEEINATTLVANLKRIVQIREWMHNPALKKLLPLLRKLPTAPKLHSEVTNELRSPTCSFEVVAGLIAQEPVMSAKLLQVVNSAFFGLAHEVTDTAEAVMVLGAERIKGLILLAGVFSQYPGAKCPSFSPEPVWAHSTQVGMFARAIALGETRNDRIADAAFTAGLLHDIGKIVLAGNLPDMYETIRRSQATRKITQRAAELEVMGTTHAELGACLLATWGLPLQILEAIAWHHEPETHAEHGFSLLAAVHCANVFAQETGPGGGGAGARDFIHVEYLLKAGLGDCRNRWREFCGLAAKPDAESEEERLRQRRQAKEN